MHEISFRLWKMVKMKTVKYILFFLLLNISIIGVEAASNPYGKYQTLYGIKTVRCTWYAWEQAYQYTGVALPGWGNAQTWYNSAINAGYKVGRGAKPNSIAVWSSSDGYGHVGFVVSVNGEYMITNEGGIVTEENEGIVNGAYKSTTAENLIGFIYLDEVPIKSNNETTKPNNNSPNNKQSSNNNLSNIKIDIDSFEFDKEKTDYKLEVPCETQIIEISVETEDKKAIATGAGKKALKVGENNYTITVTAENKSTKEYHITIIRKDLTKENTEMNQEEKELPKKQEKNYFPYLIMGIAGTSIIIVLIWIISKKVRSK